MKFRLGDKVGFGMLACGIVAAYTGVYLIQTQVQNLYANQEYDYVISTIINPGVVEGTGPVSIMHFFSNQTDATDHDLVIASVLPNTVDIINTNIPIASTQASWSNTIYYFNSTSSEDVIIIDVQAQNGVYGLFKNTATIAVDGGDPVMSNNTYRSSFVVLSDINAQADLAVVSQSVTAPDGTDAWDTVTFHFRVQNNGPAIAYGAIAQYELDSSLLVSDTSGTPVIQEAGLVQREIDELGVGQYVDFTVTAEILSTVIDQQELNNQISTSSPVTDPDTNNNTSNTSITASSDNRAIQLTMIADDTQLCLGQPNHVLVTYTNTDTAQQALGIQLNKISGMTMAHFAPSADSQSPSSYQRDMGTIAGGANGFVSFDITPTTAGNKTLTVQAFDDKDGLRDTKTINFTIDDCSSTPPPDDNNDDQPDDSATGTNHGGRRRRTVKKATGAVAEDPIKHFAAQSKNVDASMYTCAEEIAPAYTYAYEKWLTTMKTVQWFRPCDKILRIELAKILANFAVNVLGKKPDDTRICVFDDMQGADQQSKFYAELVCKLGIMWLRSNGQPDTVFRPYDTVTRAQLGTSLSRQIYGTKYNTDNEKYWFLDHLMALKKDDIMNYIDNPSMEELRSFVAIMLMRIDLLGIAKPTDTK